MGTPPSQGVTPLGTCSNVRSLIFALTCTLLLARPITISDVQTRRGRETSTPKEGWLCKKMGLALASETTHASNSGAIVGRRYYNQPGRGGDRSSQGLRHVLFWFALVTCYLMLRASSIAKRSLDWGSHTYHVLGVVDVDSGLTGLTADCPRTHGPPPPCFLLFSARGRLASMIDGRLRC